MRFFILLFSVFTFSIGTVYAHGDEDHPELKDVKTEKISEKLTMIQAGGGNIGVYHEGKNVFVVDNGLEDKRGAVMTAITHITDQPVKYLVNTHWHYDHSGNNDLFGYNDKTILLAHDNVRTRLKAGGEIKAFKKVIPPADKGALPVLTYEDSIRVYAGDDEIQIHTVDPAHTDGDSFVIFKSQNVIHTGDLFFNGFWPFIDSSSGGSLEGMIKGVETILSKTNENTKIIPGHGPLANNADLVKYYAMLKKVASRVTDAKKAGQTKEDWAKSKPLADMDAEWGKGFLSTDKFTRIVWDAF